MVGSGPYFSVLPAPAVRFQHTNTPPIEEKQHLAAVASVFLFPVISPREHLGGPSSAPRRRHRRLVSCNLRVALAMDPSEMSQLDNEDSSTMKTIKGAAMGLAAGTIWGTVVATWHDVPRVERNVALPGLVRTLKMCGSYGVTFAAVGGLYIGIEQMVQNYRMKKDFVNGAVGAFVAGATVYGYKGKSISTAISAGSALAVTSSLLDIGGQTTRVDVGKEYYPYSTHKRPAAVNDQHA